MATTWAPSRANTSAYAAPMPRAGDLAVQRSAGGKSSAPTHLAVDVGRLADSRNRMVDRGRAWRPATDRCRTAVFLPSERVNPPARRCAISLQPVLAVGLAKAANKYHAPATAEIAQYGSKNCAALEPGRLCDAGGVEDQPAEHPPSARPGCFNRS